MSPPTPNLRIEPCTESDIPDLIPIYFAAFEETIISRKCFPHTPIVEKWWSDLLLDELKNQKTSRFVKVLLDDQTIAFSKWQNIRPKVDPPTTEEPAANWPNDPNSDHTLANTFFGGLSKAHEEVCGGKQHWYLELIATGPKARGLGAATLMLRWGIEQAQQQELDDVPGTFGVSCFLEASPNGRRVFEKEGFKQIGETFKLQFEEEIYEETFMIRHPESSA